MLKDKEGLWTSDDEWKFTPFNKTHDNFIYIENSSKTKVLASSSGGKVDQENFEEGKAQQLWKKESEDTEGFFTLTNKHIPKIMTAISNSTLQIKGNIPLKSIIGSC